jgi:cytochrome c553
MQKKQKMAAITIALLALGSGSVLAQNPANTSDIVERAVHVCNACHGENGNSKVAVFPKLAGQQSLYLADQLRAFRAQKRADTSVQAYMWGVSALLTDPEIEGLADFYAQQTPTTDKPGKPALMEKGKKIFTEGIPAKNIMACTNCHGDNGEGASVFPRIAGQHAEYIVKQLVDFRTNKLRPHGVIMATRIVKNMTPDEMRAVAAYLQGLK